MNGEGRWRESVRGEEGGEVRKSRAGLGRMRVKGEEERWEVRYVRGVVGEITGEAG